MALRSMVVVVVLALAARLPAATGAGRHARNLIFTPYIGKVQAIMGFGVPVDLPHQAVTMGYVIKSNYMTPSNSTQFTRPLEAFGQRRSARAAESPTEHLASRWQLYSTLATAIEQIGAGSGRQCLLRAVCEAAAFSMRHDGLLGELLHVLLTPSSTREPVVQHEDHQFHAAEKAGRKARGAQDPVDTCGRMFGGCSTATLDLITRFLPF